MNIFKNKNCWHIIIIGCGGIGAGVASYYKNKGDIVSIIDADANNFSCLGKPAEYFLFEGDPTDIDILDAVGIKTADAVIVASSDDNENLISAKIAKNYFHVDNVVVIVNDMSKIDLYDGCNITTVCPERIISKEIIHSLAAVNEGS